ncbi:Non-specific lipid-transfer protein 2A [Acorus gramineus]|uniref:Non-specific lipid-transfer protein n=1 Tax=Acorus gramineus TaxID=55184 RepID=A0AAV9B429_ACOGR|nr:Non-specific lipid-transfer protein 2A [Acorus gramineus]
MARTTATLAILAVIAALLLVAGPRETEAAISCGQVAGFITPCVPYAQKGGPISPRCCSGVRGLNGAARTTMDRQQACTCLKSLARGNLPYATSIPSKCGVSVPYSISPNTDCTK